MYLCTLRQGKLEPSGLGGCERQSMEHKWVEEKCIYIILVVKPEGKRPLGKPRSMWVYNTKVGFRETGLIWLRVVTSGRLE
jgi:hypothetical protein